MNLSLNVLRRYISVDQSPALLRETLDDIGIEVKRVEELDGDFIFGLELLANRGDHHCYLGIAREISGRTGQKICGPLAAVLTLGSELSVQNHTELCLRYTATKMSLSNPQEGSTLSSVDLYPLEAAGIHSIISPVDATNLSNLEIGQPTHVFDASKVDGTIHIRLSHKGEQAWLLFEESHRDIPTDTIVIADDSKILAIAGVIGCEDSKATQQTTDIIIESACFDPVKVRKTGRALGVSTDALARFERGADPEMAVVGAARVVELLETVGWSLESKTTQVGNWSNPNLKIPLYIEKLNEFLGTNISLSEVVNRLQRYGFECLETPDYIEIRVPTHRIWDVENVFDLYEEIAKSIGYNSIPTTLPSIDKGALPTVLEVHRSQVEDVLLGAGFFEVITDGFYGRTDFEKLGLSVEHPLNIHVETQNSLDKGFSLLKNNCVLQAVDAVRKNSHRGFRNIKMYEWTRTFHLDKSAANGVCEEHKKLWLVVSGMERAPTWQGKTPNMSPLYLKGLVHEFGLSLGLNLEVHTETKEHFLTQMFHPHRQASIYLDGNCVGFFGEIHPNICKTFKIKKARPCYLELSQSVLEANELGRGYALFVFEEQNESKRGITYEMTFENPDGSLSADECNIRLQSAITMVLEQYLDSGVQHR